MQVHILASGSTGNAVFFEMGRTRLLVDAGISTCRIEKGLAEIGVKVSDLDGILISHEHNDHVKGLDVLIRRYEIPVYIRPLVQPQLCLSNRFPQECFKEMKDTFTIGDINVETFSTSHDASDPVGFCFHWQRYKWVLATDLGYASPEVENALKGADLAVLEANHDPDMLFKGPYPAYLKKRIRGKEGHLSNYEAGQLLSDICVNPGCEVFLAHLSRENNRPELALATVSRILENKGYDMQHDIKLHLTYPDRRSGYVK